MIVYNPKLILIRYQKLITEACETVKKFLSLLQALYSKVLKSEDPIRMNGFFFFFFI